MQLEMVPNHLPTPFPLVGKEDVPNYLDCDQYDLWKQWPDSWHQQSIPIGKIGGPWMNNRLDRWAIFF